MQMVLWDKIRVQLLLYHLNYQIDRISNRNHWLNLPCSTYWTFESIATKKKILSSNDFFSFQIDLLNVVKVRIRFCSKNICWFKFISRLFCPVTFKADTKPAAFISIFRMFNVHRTDDLSTRYVSWFSRSNVDIITHCRQSWMQTNCRLYGLLGEPWELKKKE